MNFRRTTPVVLASLLLVSAPRALTAQTYAQQVWDQLQTHYKTIAKNSSDWYLRNYVMGKLKEDGTDSWTFYFDASNSSILTAACDNDCKDVDMVIKDEDDKVVGKDTKDDDTPVIAFKPDESGKYTIEITMVKCKNDPCYFGFGIFQK
jgi:hypothetical protein